MEGTMGEIRVFAGNFAPLNWAFCDGSSLAISNYDALYALIGTTYGGDGVTTFNIPNICSRIPVGTGQGPGLPCIILGQLGGSESTTMSVLQMPSHTHPSAAGAINIPTYGAVDTLGSPAGAELAGLPGAYSSLPADTFLKPQPSTVVLKPTGDGAPFSIIQPYLAANYIICLQGIFPSRN